MYHTYTYLLFVQRFWGVQAYSCTYIRPWGADLLIPCEASVLSRLNPNHQSNLNGIMEAKANLSKTRGGCGYIHDIIWNQ